MTSALAIFAKLQNNRNNGTKALNIMFILPGLTRWERKYIALEETTQSMDVLG